MLRSLEDWSGPETQCLGGPQSPACLPSAGLLCSQGLLRPRPQQWGHSSRKLPGAGGSVFLASAREAKGETGPYWGTFPMGRRLEEGPCGEGLVTVTCHAEPVRTQMPHHWIRPEPFLLQLVVETEGCLVLQEAALGRCSPGLSSQPSSWVLETGQF